MELITMRAVKESGNLLMFLGTDIIVNVTLTVPPLEFLGHPGSYRVKLHLINQGV